MRPEISVVIPHFNDLDNLCNCLRKLANQTMPRSQYEIIVADNNSPQGLGTVQAMAEGYAARAVLATERGAGPTRNAGAGSATGEILAFIDSDCSPNPDWLEAGHKMMKLADVIGGRVGVTVLDPRQLTAVEAFEVIFAFDNESYVRNKGFSVTANLFVRRSVFEQVGGFRNGVSEDVDWCWRARTKGFSVQYDPDAIVEHPARRTWGDLTKKHRRLIREGYLLALSDQRFARLRWWIRSWAVLLSPFVLIFAAAAASKKVPRLTDRVKAIGVLFSIRAFRFAEMQRVVFKGQ